MARRGYLSTWRQVTIRSRYTCGSAGFGGSSPNQFLTPTVSILNYLVGAVIRLLPPLNQLREEYGEGR